MSSDKIQLKYINR